ncbi:hypothetical protein [Hyphomicrobium sp. CS1BSMeth3]|uniref:hypothetical protein n=1 Tax=Hyphomicrobium sp. CS1BSMeth3 TaxID=1892844 RepID=UPI00093170DC|nr:hypothetical protein [Hyphomicrobium sp. CS1BSMeth3]
MKLLRSPWRLSARTVLAICLLSGAAIATAHAAATPFQSLFGTWSGSGQIRYQDGASERIRCTAYYSGAQRALRLAIRCRGTTNAVEIRGQLQQQPSGALSGTWEERTFNAAGEASGRMSPGRMNLSISGGGLSGSMSVNYGGSRQTVVISVQGVPLRSVNITMTRG